MKLTIPAIYLICLTLLPSLALAQGVNHKCNSHNSKCNNVITKKKPQKSTYIKKQISKPQPKKKIFASNNGMHVVTIRRLNIRSQPNSHSRVLGALLHGTKVVVIRKQGVWREIMFNNQRAWVHSSYLTPSH
ncbi:MAG: SH3 domain-containing protein [Marinomonas sp.]